MQMGKQKVRRFFGRPKRVIALAAGLCILAMYAATPALAVLPGSPSKFESGNDPTLGLGNMIVDTSGDTDWVSVTGLSAYFHSTDVAAKNNDDSFTPGQKQDTTCPTTEGHKNPPKDDFTDVASFTEKASGGTHDGETYLYGATIRYAANGNASENIELKQSSTLCPGEPAGGLTVRTPGDKMIAIDYLGGGSAVQFHVLTWVASGACFVANDPNPCWGATVLTLDPNSAEGGVNTTAIAAGAATNPINGKALVAGQFAEFGVNLALAGIITAGSCKSFNQTVWESRSSGSSFVSSTKDISIESKPINQCAGVSVVKLGSDGGSQAGAVFTLYAGTGTGGTLIGSCTVAADGTCSDPSFSNLQPGTYTFDESSTPAGYDKDPQLIPYYTFTLSTNQSLVLTFTDPAQAGALVILKNSTKGGAVLQAGAVFSYDGSSVTDNGAGSTDEDPAVGSVCVSGLAPGSYSVTETSPPPGYGSDTGGAQSVTVVNGTNCTDNLPGAGATATFTNPPLSDIQVNFRDGGSGETTATITCDDATGTASDTAETGWDTSHTVIGVEAPVDIHCTISIDP
jgi:Prealbumin-like fold domain